MWVAGCKSQPSMCSSMRAPLYTTKMDHSGCPIVQSSGAAVKPKSSLMGGTAELDWTWLVNLDRSSIWLIIVSAKPTSA